MDEFFNSWFNTTAEQKEVYASAVGLSKFELESQYQQWYCCKLIEEHHAIPTSVQCDAFNNNYSNIAVSMNSSMKATVTIQRINAVFDWIPNFANMQRELEEFELELHNYDFDTPYVKRILDVFDKLRNQSVWSKSSKNKKVQSTFEMLKQYFFPNQQVDFKLITI